jgi:hypothetical protein
MLKIKSGAATGGKASKGKNKTSAIQIIDTATQCVVKQFRYKVCTTGTTGYIKAYERACVFIANSRKKKQSSTDNIKRIPTPKNVLWNNAAGKSCALSGLTPSTITLDNLICLNGWPAGTYAYLEEESVIRNLLMLCNTYGFGRVLQIVRGIEDIWRHPEKEAVYKKERVARVRQLLEDQMAYNACKSSK